VKLVPLVVASTSTSHKLGRGIFLGFSPCVSDIYNVAGGAVSHANTWNNHPLITDIVTNMTISVADGALATAIAPHNVPCVVGKAQYVLRSIPHGFNFS
jgi:hypothetical protein